MQDDTKQKSINDGVFQITDALTKIWNDAEEGYGPEIAYSVLLNVCFQFAARYQRRTKSAVKADQVVDELIYHLHKFKPDYFNECPTSWEANHTNE